MTRVFRLKSAAGRSTRDARARFSPFGPAFFLFPRFPRPVRLSSPRCCVQKATSPPMATDSATTPAADSLAAANDAASPAMVIPAQSLDSAGSSDHESRHAEITSAPVTGQPSRTSIQSAADATLQARLAQSHPPRLLVESRPLSAPPATGQAHPFNQSTATNAALVPFGLVYHTPRPASLTAQAGLRRPSVSTSAAESEEDASQLSHYVNSADYDMRGPIGAQPAPLEASSERAQSEQAGTLDMLASATRTVSQPRPGVINTSEVSPEAASDDQKRKRERIETAADGTDEGSSHSTPQTPSLTATAGRQTSNVQVDSQQSVSASRSESAAGDSGPPPAQRRRTEPAPDSHGFSVPVQYHLAQLQALHVQSARQKQEQLLRLQAMGTHAPMAGSGSSAPSGADSAAAQMFLASQMDLSARVRGASAAHPAHDLPVASLSDAQSTFSTNHSGRFPAASGYQNDGEGQLRTMSSFPSGERYATSEGPAMNVRNGSYSTSFGVSALPAQPGHLSTSHYGAHEYTGYAQAAYISWSSAAASAIPTNGSAVATPSPASTSTASGGWGTSPAPLSTTDTVATSYRVESSTSPAEELRRTPIPIKKAGPAPSKSSAYAQALTGNTNYGGAATSAAEIQVGLHPGPDYPQVARSIVPALPQQHQLQVPAAAASNAAGAVQAQPKNTSGRRQAPDDAFDIESVSLLNKFSSLRARLSLDGEHLPTVN